MCRPLAPLEEEAADAPLAGSGSGSGYSQPPRCRGKALRGGGWRFSGLRGVVGIVLSRCLRAVNGYGRVKKQQLAYSSRALAPSGARIRCALDRRIRSDSDSSLRNRIESVVETFTATP